MTTIEWVLTLHVWAVATVTPLLDRCLSLRRLLTLATPPRRRQPYRSVEAERIVETVLRRLRHPRQMRRRACLRRGLVLFHFLRLAGRPAALHIGALPLGADRRRLQTHCWISLDGRAVAEDPPEDLRPLLICRDAVRPVRHES